MKKTYLLVILSVAAAGLGGQIHADPIGLDIFNQSTVSAGAGPSPGPGATNVKDDVNSLPYTTPASANYGSALAPVAATITPALTTSELSFAISESVPAFQASSNLLAGVGADIYFIAGANVSYALGGSLSVVGNVEDTELSVSLQNITTHAYSYRLGPEEITNTFLLPTTPTEVNDLGNSTGSLISGDLYEFDAEVDLSNHTAAQLSGNLDAAFTQAPSVPEPTSLCLLGVGVGALVLLRRRLAASQL